MMNKVEKFITDNEIFKHGDSVLLGVSGGADSTCLLYVLNDLKEKFDLKLLVVHVNHGIRGEEADRDAMHVKKMCKKLNVPFRLKEIDVPSISKETGKSEEEAGRDARYAAFFEIAKEINADKIAVAHNLNDNSETILFNLFRGTGIKGLTGIPVKREKIVRPLLCCTREEIEDYLNTKGIEYQNDSTNSDTEYSRNKLRLDVIPYIKKNINEKVEYNIVNAANNLSEIYEYIDSQAEVAYKEYVIHDIIINDAEKLPTAILSEVIRKQIYKIAGKLKDITRVHVQSVKELLKMEVSKKIELPYNLVAIKKYEGVEITPVKETENHEPVPEQMLIKENKIYSVPNMEIMPEKADFDRENIEELLYTKWFDYDKIDKLVLRTRKPGDYIVIDDNGRTKKLKEYFINEKIPREERDKVLLLADGNSIVWVLGYRISAKYKVTKDTKNIIKISYDKEKKDDTQNK